MNAYIIFFFIMVIFGIFFNAMNILAYRMSDLYLSLTLVYSGLFMASTMLVAHEIINFINNGKFNYIALIIGIVLCIILTILLRKQVCVNKQQWLRRMISHHSTAITTTKKLLENNKDIDEPLYDLATNIIKTQEEEIDLMKNMLK